MEYMTRFEKKKNAPLKSKFPGTSDEGIDLLRKML
eukprot:CAMPEP_0176390710 /NCGR_PEP_ID=MMETSP0126-20121128/39403_1 /TAXON_ID=141414 ORGANISM="Strombidinopsis acuminatum, Strain SPMC142" /NCGR_SAMPLE_ID=MMETSP0126 /ASSEMBLY_ACC=CAM_ASM_000229 /LENGTH=34 /DNA_ID= /DNA_START= /DNA_END= /DNA_ORIENTATION=